mmetsp:Transcript_3116/g.19211  ORF Transcript_3116/g.19211 Transcript_3116/m.19211 type:complete len:108 (-) Transcript_3116:55-378(-)
MLTMEKFEGKRKHHGLAISSGQSNIHVAHATMSLHFCFILLANLWKVCCSTDYLFAYSVAMFRVRNCGAPINFISASSILLLSIGKSMMWPSFKDASFVAVAGRISA